jgi:hypothetical protein
MYHIRNVFHRHVFTLQDIQHLMFPNVITIINTCFDRLKHQGVRNFLPCASTY